MVYSFHESGGILSVSYLFTLGSLINKQRTFLINSAAVGIAVTILFCPKLTYYMKWATIAYTVMLIGFCYRSKPRIHAPLMNIAIFADFALVFLLEYQRSAIKTAVSLSLTFWQQMHIGFSSLAVCLYFPVLYLGWRCFLNRASSTTARRHRQLAILALVFRSLGFLLMFSLIK